MSLDVTIGGTPVTIDEGTLQIASVVNGIDRLSVDVTSLDGSVRPALDAELIVMRNGTRIFGGLIDEPTEHGFQGVGLTPITTELNVLDFNDLPKRRYVSATIPAGTLKAALQIVVVYLAPYGITLDPAQATGPSLPALTYDYAPLTTVFADLEGLSGWVRDISYTKVLGMYAPGAAAPFNITDGDGYVDGDLVVKPSRANYANRVILRFSAAERTAYAFLLLTANFTDGETVTVGSKTYTFQTTLTDVDGHVHLGGTAADSLIFLACAIRLAGGAGSSYAASMTIHSSVTGYETSATMLKVVALEPGAAGNSIACTETCANASWIGEGSVPLVTLQNGTDQTLTNVVTANHAGEQAAHGLWEIVVDAADCTNATTAQALANAELLVRIAAPLRHVRYATYQDGLKRGQTQTINSATRHINISCLITEVRARDVRGLMRYEVTAVEGSTPPGSWRDTYQQWSGGSAASALSAVSGAASAPLRLMYGLGGSRALVVSPSPAAWTPIAEWLPVKGPVAFDARVRCWLWALHAGITVSCRVRSGTDGITFGTTVTSLADVTSQTPVERTGTLLVAVDVYYRLEVLPSAAGEGCGCLGYLESA
jgi:hypothetical protein